MHAFIFKCIDEFWKDELEIMNSYYFLARGLGNLLGRRTFLPTFHLTLCTVDEIFGLMYIYYIIKLIFVIPTFSHGSHQVLTYTL